MEVVAQELRHAFQKVAANRGAAGPDRQTIEEVREHLDALLPRLSKALLDGSYRAGDIRRVWIPKTGGGERGLGIPNVVDRVVQEAVRRVLEPEYEPTFRDESHGFRPDRSCQTAIAAARKHVEEGYEWVVDLDLEKFFDRVNHQRLMARLALRVEDQRVLALIHGMLKAKVVMPDGVVVSTEEGVPQGGPLSPLLSNIVLDELDQELARRGHRFVRYADDCAPRRRGRRPKGRQKQPCCMRDEGRPLGIGLQDQVSNHRKLPGPMARVVSVLGKGGLTRQVSAGKANVSKPLTTCRKRRDAIETRLQLLAWDKLGGSLSTAQAMAGMKAARARHRLSCGTWEPVAPMRREISKRVDPVRSRVPMRGEGADRLVIVTKSGNADGAKEPTRPAAAMGQLERGGADG
jgi:retron-type reverse transcriptase